MTFEYKVVPAPTRGRRVKGVKTPADRFARAVEDVINDLAEDGWEYMRTDTLPAEERQGLTGRTTVYQNLLVFRRAVETSETVRTEPEVRVEPTPPPVAKPADVPNDEAAEDTTAKNTLNSMIEEEIAAARAPKLPSAGKAQDAPETTPRPVAGVSRRDMAAE